MLLQDQNERKWRSKILRILRESSISSNTRLALTKPLAGKPEGAKEELAKKLCEIIENSQTEEEMLKKVSNLQG